MKMGELHHIQENMGWPDTNYYEYTYDKYYFPNIIKIIDDILSGNEDQIESLFSEEDLKYDINNYRDISPQLRQSLAKGSLFLPLRISMRP